MRKEIKLVRLEFSSIYKSRLEHFPELLQFYMENTEFLNIDDYTYPPKPHDMDYSEWDELYKDNDKLKKYLYDNPCFAQFKYTMDFEQYGEFDFKHYNKKLGYIVVDRFTTKVEYDFDLVAVNDHFMLVQNQIIDVMKKQLDSIAAIGLGMHSGQHYNERCNSPVSDVFLHKVNQTMVLYDCCSDRLQEQISKGWRIISVAPQPNQRRPDYVLGIVMDENEIKSFAEREEGVW